MHAIILGLLIGWVVLGAGITVWNIGKPRRSLTNGEAIFALCMSALFVVGLVFL